MSRIAIAVAVGVLMVMGATACGGGHDGGGGAGSGGAGPPSPPAPPGPPEPPVPPGGGALVFSNVTVVPKDTSAVVKWRTSEAGTGQLEYGPSTDYGSLSGEERSSFRQSIELSGLEPGTLYHFRIRARDEQGGGTLSDDFTFTTLTRAEFETRVRAARADGGLPRTTIVDPSQSVSAVVALADAGDTIYLRDGTWTGEHVEFGRSGIDIAPITLAAYDEASNGMPTLDGVDGTGTGITSQGRSFLVIRGIRLTRYGEGVYILNADDVTIQGNDISDMSARGVWLRGWDDFYRHRVLDNTLTNCAISGGSVAVIYIIGGSGVDCEVKNNRILNTNGAGINSAVRDSLLEGNTISNTLGRMFTTGAFSQDNIYAMNTLENGQERGFRIDRSGRRIRIIGNRMLNIPAGLALDIYPDNQVYFARNYLENTSGIALAPVDSVFEHNIFVWTGAAIDSAYLSFGTGGSRTVFRNNTMVNCRGASGSYGWRMGGATDCSVTNNIFVNSRFYFSSSGGTNRIAYNDFWDVSTDLTGIALDSTNISADPLFADAAALDFHLKSRAGRWSGSGWVLDDVTSPCIDAGDPASPFDAEPVPNGGRINMGVYGNTPEASKSP